MKPMQQPAMQISKPWLTGLEYTAVLDALMQGHLSDGVVARQFEDDFKKMGYQHAVALNSGTSALHLALLAWGIGPGDEVIVTPYTFVASVNVVLAVGATPVFADIDRTTYCLDPTSVHKKVTSRTKAVIPVDVFGVPADVDMIRSAVPSHVKILLDSVESIGSKYKGKPVGLTADAGAYGFFPNKQITSAEGGMLYSNDAQLIAQVSRLAKHGATEGDPVYQCWGLNNRMSDLHAALGRAQLQRLDQMEEARKKVVCMLDLFFGHLRRQRTREGDSSTQFIYCIELPIDKMSMGKKEFISKMAERGIPVKPYFNNLSLLPHLSKYRRGFLANAYEVSRRTVSLPMHHDLKADDVLLIHEAYLQVLEL